MVKDHQSASATYFHKDHHSATGSDGTVYAQLSEYQPSGKLGRIDFGNGVWTTYTYDG